MARRERKTSARRIKMPAFPCPVCGEAGLSTHSEPMSRTLRRLRYFCSAHECGHTWTAHLEYIATVSPSAVGTVEKPAPFLRLKDRPDRPPIGAPQVPAQPPP